jgi:FkbM family methyltransferase
MSRFRRWLGRLSGTHIFRTLPRGIDLGADLSRWLPRFRCEVVFDVGAHHGQSVDACLRWFPAARIYCFEPVAQTYGVLARRVAAIARVRPVQLALGAAAGEACIRLEGTSDMYRIDRDPRSETAGATERVTVDTVDQFAGREGINRIGLLKVDTEGHDLAVLEGAGRMLRREAIDLIQVEAGWHPGNRRHVPVEAFKAHLEARGYRLFGIYQQVGEWPTGQPHLRRADLVFISGPAREGRQERMD